jgi:hypothetical protein
LLRAELWRRLSKKEQEDQVETMKKVTKNMQQSKHLKGNLDVIEVYRKGDCSKVTKLLVSTPDRLPACEQAPIQ